MPGHARDGENAGSDFFGAWLDAHRALFGAAAAGPVWQRAEALYRAWAQAAEGFAGAHGARHAGPGASPFDPAGWLRGAGAGGLADLMRWLEGPELSDLFGAERLAIRGLREWLAYLAAVEQMKAVIGEGWLAAFGTFAARLAERPAAERPGWPEMLALWQEIGAVEMTRMQRSAPFLAATRDLIEAETALRRAVRARVEPIADLCGLPTRVEIDDLHRTVTDLRRELRRARGLPPVRGSRREAT